MSAVEPPRFAVVEAVSRALAEDLTPLGDLTSALLPPDLIARADVVVRTGGVVAGIACASETFLQVDGSVDVAWSVGDGALVEGGTTIGTVVGPLASILTGERTALNFLGHLSGIATLTRRFVVVAAAAGHTRIWDTRKTTPGLRSLEKAAVRAGGGVNHRGNLSDWVLLKDNHLALMGMADAVAAARARWPGRTVHVECDRLDQLREALDAGVDAVLLDNMTPEEVGEAVDAADAHAGGTGRRPLLEISGGISLETVTRYVGLGADMISVGGLTNSAPVLDIGLDIEPRELTVLLTIDAGNTETVVGLYDLDGPEPDERTRAEDGLIDHWRIATEAERTADEMAVLLQGFLSLRGFGLDEVEGLAVSSGVPRVKESMRQLADRYLDFDPVMIEPGVRTGIAILAENPKEVGADRIANAVAAFDLFGGPTIVADFGTATTCDAVSAKGEYLGGAIAPGIGISMDALVGRAAALGAVELIEPRSVLGKTTVECIQSGAVYGFAAQVDGLCERIQRELGECTIISTGGLADLITPLSTYIDHSEPWLTLHGLRLVYEKNV